MEYRAVGNRCAVDFSLIDLPISIPEALEILSKKGFCPIEVDEIVLARGLVGWSKYRRSARLSEAPEIVDCSSMVKWLYGERGIWLPRRTIQQLALGNPVNPGDLRAGDLIFTSGFINYYFTDPTVGVGHVGIATGDHTVVHAANSRAGIIESPLQDFFDDQNFRGARRYVASPETTITFITPPEREVETADDIGWIIRQSLP